MSRLTIDLDSAIETQAREQVYHIIYKHLEAAELELREKSDALADRFAKKISADAKAAVRDIMAQREKVDRQLKKP